MSYICDYYDTLGGLLISILGYIPDDQYKDAIPFKNIDFYIEEIKDRRIVKVKIILKEDS